VTRSCNHCRGGKVLSPKYSETVFIALVIQHAMRMRHVVICSLPGSTIYYIYIYIYHILHIHFTAIGFTPGGSSTSHICTQTIHIIQSKENLGSAGRAPSLQVIPWHLPYN
jgi:hypothetical protein